MCHFHFVQFFRVCCSLGKERVNKFVCVCVCMCREWRKKNLYVFNLFYANHILHNYCCVFLLCTSRKKEQKNCVCDLYSWFKIRSFFVFLCVSVWTAKRQIGCFFPEYYVVCSSVAESKYGKCMQVMYTFSIFLHFTFS